MFLAYPLASSMPGEHSAQRMLHLTKLRFELCITVWIYDTVVLCFFLYFVDSLVCFPFLSHNCRLFLYNLNISGHH